MKIYDGVYDAYMLEDWIKLQRFIFIGYMLVTGWKIGFINLKDVAYIWLLVVTIRQSWVFRL